MGARFRWIALGGCWALFPFQVVGLTMKTTGEQEPDVNEQVNKMGAMQPSGEAGPTNVNGQGNQYGAMQGNQYGAMQGYGMQPYGMQPYGMHPYAYNPLSWLYPVITNVVKKKITETINKDIKKAIFNGIFHHPHSRTQKLSDHKEADEDEDEYEPNEKNPYAESGEDNEEDESDDVARDSNQEDSDDDMDDGEHKLVLGNADEAKTTRNRKQGFAVTRGTFHGKLDKRHHIKKARRSVEEHKEEETIRNEDQTSRVAGLPAPGPLEYAQPMPEMVQPPSQPMPDMATPPSQFVPPMGVPLAQPMPPVGQPLSPYGPFFPPEFMPPPPGELPPGFPPPGLQPPTFG